MGFLGRWNPTKGVDLLVKAVQMLPQEIPLKLVIHAVATSAAEAQYREQVIAIAAGDERMHIAEPLPRAKVSSVIANFDLLAVPSQWLETGPLVVLEAQAVGTPVLGSNLGGIGELVQHQVDGWLIPTEDIDQPRAWCKALAHLATHPAKVKQLSQNILPVRTMKAMAQDFADIYHRIANCKYKIKLQTNYLF